MTFGTLLRREFQSLLRFPLLEILVAFFTFGALSLKATSSALTGAVTWDYARTYVTTFSTLIFFDNLSELYLPAAALTVVFLSLTVVHEYESGHLKTLLSYPVSRRAVFISKYIAVYSVVTLALILALSLAAVLGNLHDLPALVGPLNWELWPGLIFGCALLSAALVSISFLVAVVARNLAIALTTATAIFFGLYFAGHASNHPLLPPAALRGQDALLFLANPAPGSGEWFLPAALSYGAVAITCTLGAYWIFTRKLEVA